MNRKIDNDVISQFKKQLTQEERAPATIEKYLRDVKKFCSFAGIGVEITKETAIEYKRWLQQHYEINSANSMLAALNLDLQTGVRAVRCGGVPQPLLQGNSDGSGGAQAQPALLPTHLHFQSGTRGRTYGADCTHRGTFQSGHHGRLSPCQR